MLEAAITRWVNCGQDGMHMLDNNTHNNCTVIAHYHVMLTVTISYKLLQVTVLMRSDSEWEEKHQNSDRN